MSMAGLGLEWVRRKHPELRPEHPERRRQRFCRVVPAAALRESSLQKREAAAGWCCRLVPPVAAAAHPELRRELQAGSHRLHSHHNRSAHALPPLPKRVEPANASDAADADRGRSAAIAAAGSRTSTHALRTPRAADLGFSRHQRSMRRRWLVVRPVPLPLRSLGRAHTM